MGLAASLLDGSFIIEGRDSADRDDDDQMEEPARFSNNNLSGFNIKPTVQ